MLSEPDMRSFLLVFVMGASIVLGGCPKDATNAPACSDYLPPASFDAQGTKVSFSTDVMPIFQGSCAFSSCHGLEASNNGVFLGDSQGPAAVVANLVGRRADTLQTMDYVKPGDPHESFLMRKIDGSQCVLDAQCTDKTCGQSMPRDEDVMPIETRDTIRRWIAQGAQNN
jgi:hypothetical protein